MTQTRTTRASHAYKAAMRHVDLLTEQTTVFRQEPAMARRIDSVMRGILPGWDNRMRARFSPEELVRLGDLLGEIAVSELWKRNGRVMYDLHEELAAALYRSKMDKVPGDLFNRLPHINPMIVLPDPWTVETGSDGLPRASVRCFYVVGRSGEGVCNSNDPERDGLVLMFCYDVLDEETGEIVPSPQRDLIPLPMDRKVFTAADAVSFAGKWQGATYEIKQARDIQKTFRPLLQKAFAVLTYLCTDNRDLDEDPAWMNQGRKKTGKGRRARDREPFWVRVGWYVGPALHTARQRALSTRRDGPSIPSGVEYGPQHRAGHFKTVWIGPGKSGQRMQSTTTWVEPYWTKLEDLPEDVDPPTQVVPVDPQRGDPFRRRGTVGK